LHIGKDKNLHKGLYAGKKKKKKLENSFSKACQTFQSQHYILRCLNDMQRQLQYDFLLSCALNVIFGGLVSLLNFFTTVARPTGGAFAIIFLKQ